MEATHGKHTHRPVPDESPQCQGGLPGDWRIYPERCPLCQILRSLRVRASARTSRQKGARNQISPGRDLLGLRNLNCHWAWTVDWFSGLFIQITSQTHHISPSPAVIVPPPHLVPLFYSWPFPCILHTPLPEVLQGLLIVLRTRGRKILDLSPGPVPAASWPLSPSPSHSSLRECLAVL